MNGQDRVEQVGKPNPVGFGYQAEQRAVAVETPGPALLHDLEVRFVVAVEQHIRHSTGRILVGQLERVGTEPLNADDTDDGIRQDPANRGVGLEIFESRHRFVAVGVEPEPDPANERARIRKQPAGADGLAGEDRACYTPDL